MKCRLQMGKGDVARLDVSEGEEDKPGHRRVPTSPLGTLVLQGYLGVSHDGSKWTKYYCVLTNASLFTYKENGRGDLPLSSLPHKRVAPTGVKKHANLPRRPRR